MHDVCVYAFSIHSLLLLERWCLFVLLFYRTYYYWMSTWYCVLICLFVMCYVTVEEKKTESSSSSSSSVGWWYRHCACTARFVASFLFASLWWFGWSYASEHAYPQQQLMNEAKYCRRTVKKWQRWQQQYPRVVKQMRQEKYAVYRQNDSI